MESELSFRAASVYVHRETGEKRVIINHNPMALQSLELRLTDGVIDLSTLRVITVDELIGMRKSPEWKDAGDLPEEALQQILEGLLQIPGMPEELSALLRAMQKELKTQIKKGASL